MKHPGKPSQHRGKPAPKQTVPQQRSSARTDWQNVAEWYDNLVGDEGSDYHQNVILPGVLRMLQLESSAAPLRILDLACGQGVFCRGLAQHSRHRIEITGIDAASALIAAAQSRNAADRLPITYLTADATKLLPSLPSPLAPNHFDFITCILAIQNMTPLSPIWQACHSLLKPAGSLLLVMMHPAFRIPKQSAWGWDEKAQTQFRRIDQYLTSSKTPIQMHPGSDPSSTTLTFHRPLQAYINTLGSHGLLIDHIEEWPSHKKSQPGPKAAALNQSRKEIPLFLALRARKIENLNITAAESPRK